MAEIKPNASITQATTNDERGRCAKHLALAGSVAKVTDQATPGRQTMCLLDKPKVRWQKLIEVVTPQGVGGS